MRQQQLNEDDKLAWLALARTDHIGPITFRQLIRRFGTAKEALDALPRYAAKANKKFTPRNIALEKARQEIDALSHAGGELICACEPDYPERLTQIEDAPPVLTVRGRRELLHANQVGVVGARNASLNGRKMAESIAQTLCDEGYVITSGLARGIDTSAHTRALDSGTVAVVAGGVNIIYPQENTALYTRMCEMGCVVSEQPWGSEPIAHLFPKRNRIISGLSLGVVVVEAAKRSGSLITAHQALEQGREVFAVPGSPLDPRAGGTNELLKQGAIFTESGRDIIDHIIRMQSRPRALCERQEDDFVYAEVEEKAPDRHDLDTAREEILMNLSTSPISVDELARGCQLSLPLVLSTLLDLELEGAIERQPGQRIVLTG
ncbi:MAG: DNA-protecting protein DprA [Proteobacteria bacterium]|jgi:DNA processing protein|nr:DNA-protecting protein DprA [Pseudomonadota bacterium]